MGYYIETPGKNLGKAFAIAEEHDGSIVTKEESYKALVDPDLAVIIVVGNGLWEAAAFAYNEKEWLDFHTDGDTRSKKYVILNRDKAKELTDYHGD